MRLDARSYGILQSYRKIRQQLGFEGEEDVKDQQCLSFSISTEAQRWRARQHYISPASHRRKNQSASSSSGRGIDSSCRFWSTFRVTRAF